MAYEGYELNYPVSAAQAQASERAEFVRRVYMHLAGAVLALIGVETILLNTLDHNAVLRLMLGSQLSWLVVMGLFMAAGYVAQMWARSQSSKGLQYAGLGLYVVAWAIVFLPLMILATHYSPDVIPQAGILTGVVFGGLTLSVFVTRKDFSFLGPIVSIGFMIAFGVIVCACLFGFSLGLFFCFAVVALISASILYNTSKVMLHYPTNMYVAASLELLADVALLFWYIVQILMLSGRRD
jgi:hypothetical protein